ncbi:hypothetical protein INR49_032548 [Caranx melampygus]|nr:hypothetical protein INR49_032548 [Caranx melampygus]
MTESTHLNFLSDRRAGGGKQRMYVKSSQTDARRKRSYIQSTEISVMKLTLVLEQVSTLLTTSMSVSCSSSMEQSEEELGSLSALPPAPDTLTAPCCLLLTQTNIRHFPGGYQIECHLHRCLPSYLQSELPGRLLLAEGDQPAYEDDSGLEEALLGTVQWFSTVLLPPNHTVVRLRTHRRNIYRERGKSSFIVLTKDGIVEAGFHCEVRKDVRKVKLPEVSKEEAKATGLIRVSRVRGVPWHRGAGKPGIKQANIQSCSRSALHCNACIHSRKRRTPSRRIYKEVHRDREKKESTAEEMEVEEQEQEASSSEEEDSDTSSVSEDGDSSEMDEEDCERRRMECLDEMSNLEKQFTDLKDQLYRERLSQVNSKLAEVEAGRAAEYLEPLAVLLENMQVRTKVAGIYRELCLESVKNKYQCEIQAACQHWEVRFCAPLGTGCVVGRAGVAVEEDPLKKVGGCQVEGAAWGRIVRVTTWRKRRSPGRETRREHHPGGGGAHTGSKAENKELSLH